MNRIFLTLFSLLWLFLSCPVKAQNTGVSPVIAAGKRATVFVDTPDAEGSGFCIDSSGIFATNAHVVEGYTRVKVAVLPATPEQKVIIARVSHMDSENDIAILVADPPLKQQVPNIRLTALPLGRVDTVYETMPVAVFGFPLGTWLAVNETELPAVTITTGRVTALRKSRDVLKEIQLDAAVNHGNSGGPAIDEKGEVIGIVYATIEGGAGLNFAIPISLLQGLMQMPEIIFEPEPIDWAKRSNPQDFVVRLAPLTESRTPPNYQVEFALKNNNVWRDIPTRLAPADAKSLNETAFRATAQLFPQGAPERAPLEFRIVVKQNGKSIVTQTGNLLFQNVPPQPGQSNPNFPSFSNPANPNSPLSFQPGAPQLNPANGHYYQMMQANREISWFEAKEAATQQKLQGASGHLVTISSADEQKFIVEKLFARTDRIAAGAWLGGYQNQDAAEPEGGWRWVTGEPWAFTAWANAEPNDAGDEDFLQIGEGGGWNDGREKQYGATSFLIEFDTGKNGAPATPISPDAPQTVDDKTFINLGGPIADVSAGGGGRFLLFYLKTQQKIAVFDAEQGKIARYISTPAENVLFTAGQDKLVVVLNDQNLIQRWNLLTGEREKTVPLPDDQPINGLAMGSASQGPILMNRRADLFFLDLNTLQIKNPLSDKMKQHHTNGQMAASADGSLFSVAHQTQRNLWTYEIQGDTVRASTMNNTGQSSLGRSNLALPSFDGRWLFMQGQVLTGDAKPVSAEHLKDQTLIPVYDPAYFIGIGSARSSSGGGGFGDSRFGSSITRNTSVATLYSANDRRRIVDLPALGELSGSNGPRLFNRSNDTNLTLEKQVHYLPRYQTLATIGAGLDQIIVRRFDLRKAFGDADFLFVSSIPPRQATKGKIYSYQIEAQSKKGNVTYKIENGPDGATLSPTGLLQWTPTADAPAGEQNIIVSLRDASGQEIFHSFRVRVE